MLRRPATSITLTTEDISAYEDTRARELQEAQARAQGELLRQQHAAQSAHRSQFGVGSSPQQYRDVLGDQNVRGGGDGLRPLRGGGGKRKGEDEGGEIGVGDWWWRRTRKGRGRFEELERSLWWKVVIEVISMHRDDWGRPPGSFVIVAAEIWAVTLGDFGGRLRRVEIEKCEGMVMAHRDRQDESPTRGKSWRSV